MAKEKPIEQSGLKDLNPKVIWWVAAAGLAVVVVVLAVLVPIAVTSTPERAAIWIDVISRSFAILAGVAAGFALWLAFRRQRAHEIAVRLDLEYREAQQRHHEESVRKDQTQRENDARDARDDAVERRITELRIQAVEQLGSEKAAVRIGGLHNLERLAEHQPTLRQIVVNEICAYLRMPHSYPGTNNHQSSDTQQAADATESTVLRQEMQVRITAQQVLARHLRADDSHYWGEDILDLSLSGATLIDADFRNCTVTNLNLAKAVFVGDADFRGCVYKGRAIFYECRFHGSVRFDNGSFEHNVDYRHAKFDHIACFAGVTFHQETGMDQVVFNEEADFTSTLFKNSAVFREAVFGGCANFDDSTFNDSASFASVSFKSDAWYAGARFDHETWFDSADFAGCARFEGISTARRIDLMRAKLRDSTCSHRLPSGWTATANDSSGLDVIQIMTEQP